MNLTKQSVVNIHFKADVGEWPVAIPDANYAAGSPVAPTSLAGSAGYRAIAVILSDKSMLLEGVGRRMRIIDAPVENM